MAGTPVPILAFLGTPIIAIGVGVLLAIIPLSKQNMMKDFYELTNETLKVAGPILFITAAGGVLGNVIASSTLVDFIKENLR